MDTAQAGAPAVAAPTETDSRASIGRIASLERELAEIAAASVERHDEAGLALRGFADVGLGSRNPINPDRQGAMVGSLGFYLTPRLGDRAKGLFELVFEYTDEGELLVDLERAQLGYQFAAGAEIWLGRFHTPYGFYNTAFHHGHQIAVSARRPRFIQFEDQGGILPAHTVGAWLTGSRRTGLGKFSYDFYVGNAQRIVNGSIDMNTAGGLHGDAIFGGNIGLRIDQALDGLTLGASAFTVKVENDGIPSRGIPSGFTRVNNYGLYVVYDTDHWENIAEFYVFDNKDLTGTGARHRSDAGFVQLAYRKGRFTPYARYERASLEQADNFFAAQDSGSSYHREALGLRFDLDLSSALKFEFAQTRLTDCGLRLTDCGPDEYDEALIQYAIRF